MNTDLHESFLQLIRSGIGHTETTEITNNVDWAQLKALADKQGLSAVVLDGLDKLNTNDLNSTNSLPLQMKLEWIGEVLQNYEIVYPAYKKAIGNLAKWHNEHGFKMMVLKGYACSLGWPRSDHRPCGDIDIWQFGKQKEADKILANTNFSNGTNLKIDRSHHHHTVFEWQGFTVENHYDFVNVHAHKSSKELEVIFKELGYDDTHIVEIDGEKVYLPSANLHALFLIKHMVSHFAAAEISLRQVLDWAFFVEKHAKEIDWKWLVDLLDKYHMKDFYNCINTICVGDLGFDVNIFPNVQFNPAMKDKVLHDILNPEYGSSEESGLFKRIAYKWRRWKGNEWKQRLCYDESRWSAFWRGTINHLMKPSSI